MEQHGGNNFYHESFCRLLSLRVPQSQIREQDYGHDTAQITASRFRD
jgi:hypothetical protein